ncbi:MAG TPA: hypothetical protein VJ770_21010 [Stellaceae bacterium]|nr:hypothetical protein [Stellaceae bacterium]
MPDIYLCRPGGSPGRVSTSTAGAGCDMGKAIGGLIMLVILLVLGGGIFLATWSPPAPSAPVERVIPNARFAK